MRPEANPAVVVLVMVQAKLGQGLLTLPLSRPKVSNSDPGGRPAVRPGPRNGVGGVWRPAPNSASGSGYHAILTEAEGWTAPIRVRVVEVQ